MNNISCRSLFLLILVFIINLDSLQAQERNCNYVVPNQATTWVFGEYARIKFAQPTNEILPTSGNYGLPFGSSSISDENGNLILFSNGENVWNKSYNLMQNGSGLAGSKYGGQSSLIVPHPGNSNKYFIFTTNKYISNFYTEGINYSVADFSSSNMGEVTSKNNQILTKNSKVISAVRHSNNTDYWVIVHGFGDENGGTFYSFHVDTLGVNPTPVSSTVGSIQKDDINNQFGYLKASPNGTKLAITLPSIGIIELFDFNNETGSVSNPISTNPGSYYFPFGLEFSPDNTKLYATTSPLNPDTSYLYQFNLLDPDPLQTPVVINKFAYNGLTSDSLMYGLQMGVDGKIYVSKTMQGGIGMTNLDVIYNPNRDGLSCNFNELNSATNNGISLNGAMTQSGLPDFVSTFLNIPHFYYQDQCLNDTTNFIIRNTANLTPSWNFKDPAGTSDLSNPMNPKYIFSEAGTYDVELTESYEGETYTFSEDVLINPLPSVDIGLGSNIIYILQGSSIRLDAGDGMDVYSWTPASSNNQYLDVDQEGYYIATVTDFNCCSNSDTVEIKYASLSYPNAFKPTSNIPDNKTFKVLGDISAISKYQFRIFNRWGQLIFETDNPQNGWDGTQDGEYAPMGTYIYTSVFTSFESGIQSAIDITDTGTVTLIR